ncbi:MAG: hypothetical protein K8R23_05655 [Chthoniobacter sp.]|nr:hypothetical protein [Chthoniobacter sp.]
MSARFEAFLARIYVDAGARARFLADPRASCAAAGLSAEETEAAEKIDRLGLHMAANSLERKRSKRRGF